MNYSNELEHQAYICISVVEIDNQTERTAPHRLSRDEGVLKRGLSLGWNYCVQRESCEVLDVKLVVLRVPERSIERLNNEILCTLIGEAHQKFYNVVRWKV